MAGADYIPQLCNPQNANDQKRAGLNLYNQLRSFDDGNEDFTDVYAFNFMNPDEPELLNNFDTVDEALQFVLTAYSATLDKFVNRGMIQDEYKDYLKTRNK